MYLTVKKLKQFKTPFREDIGKLAELKQQIAQKMIITCVGHH